MIARDRRIPRAAQAWSRLLLGCGAALGSALALALVLVFKRGLALFTADPAVVAQVSSIWPAAAAALALCSCMMIMDGERGREEEGSMSEVIILRRGEAEVRAACAPS